MAHGPQEVDVLAAVAVGVADLEVDARLAGEAPHGGGLAGSPQDRALDAAREDVPHPLEPRAQDVLDPELARHRLDLEGQRRRRDHDRVPAPAVGGQELEHLRVQQAAERAAQEPVSHLRQMREVVAAQGLDAHAHEPVEVGAAGPGVEADPHEPGRLGGRHVVAPRAVLDVRGRRVAVDQRPVEVEERPDLRPRGPLERVVGESLGHLSRRPWPGADRDRSARRPGCAARGRAARARRPSAARRGPPRRRQAGRGRRRA